MAMLFDRAERRLTGSDFSPLVDAFHPTFPASVEDYISRSLNSNRNDPIHGRPGQDDKCLDRGPCQSDHFGHLARCLVSNASVSRYSGESDCASDVLHYPSKGHGDYSLLGTSGPIFELPSEISDLILSYLSPAALDAATHTCRDWRTRILSNSWVLSSVLGVKGDRSPLDGSPSRKLSHRDLLKKLVRDSDLPSTSQHSDAWRTRFRTRNLEFSTPSPSSTPTRFAFVAAARTGTQNGFLVFQLRGLVQSTLVIYRLDLAELPWYAGTIYNVEGHGALYVICVTEVRQHAAWVLKIGVGNTAGLYSLTTHEAFSKLDSRFLLKRLASLEEVPTLPNGNFVNQELDMPFKPLPVGDWSWKVLAAFPPNGGLRHVCFSKGLRQHTEPHFLAEQTETGNLHVIMKVDAAVKPSPHAGSLQPQYPPSNHSEHLNHYFLGTALLSRPVSNSAYKNVSVAQTVTIDGNIRVAIIWQTTTLEKPISELYIYDIPEAVYFEPCKSYNHNTIEDPSTEAGDLTEGALPQPSRLIHGKRITSLDQSTGGIHPHSPLYQLASPQETALGGLQFPHTTENQDTFPRNIQYQKCFVWGPATSEAPCTQISFKVFDFSFADPQRLHSLTAYGAETGQHPDQSCRRIELNSLHCACALHDDGFRIVLPDITASVASKPVTTTRESSTSETMSSWLPNFAIRKGSLPLEGIISTLWPRKPSPAQKSPLQDIGSISRNDSPARRAALERRQKWLRGRIVGMKREGLSDFEIAELWNMSAWTRYGQVRKPEGWQGLGVVEESVDDDVLMVA